MAEDQENLFKPFQRLAPRPTANEDSCGLGLHIVKHIVERHGGRVWVETEPKKGSVFGFDIPVQPQANLEPVSEVIAHPVI